MAKRITTYTRKNRNHLNHKNYLNYFAIPLLSGLLFMVATKTIAFLFENRKNVSHAKVAKRLVSVELCGLCVKENS